MPRSSARRRAWAVKWNFVGVTIRAQVPLNQPDASREPFGEAF